MRKILSFLTAILFAGSMMATDVEVIIYASSGDYYAKTQSWTNSTQYDQVVLDEVITANRIGTTNNGKYYSDWRFYTNGSTDGSFSIDAAAGYELQSATFTYTVSNSGALYFGETKLTSGTAVELSGNKAVFQCKNTNSSTNGQVRLTKIAVTYAASQGGEEPIVEPNVKTIYCKVAQDWWKTDGAAVGAYAWKGETANAAWPGARMTAVEGEADLWKIDLDVNAYESIIFTRVNASGDIADWGAKTADLTIPTDDKDLYTITSTSAVWGDPGVTGEWSKYAASEPVTPQPAAVVLPAVLDVTNVSFRSEGMPDFVIEEGQDYAGTYFDMGAHDSSNDTLLYAEWNVTIQPIKYNVAVDVYNTNSWRVQLDLLNQADEVVKAIRYKGSSGQKGQFAIGSLDLSDLEAGDYKVRARAATAWSAMKLKDVIFAADYQGVSVELPGTLQPAYAELSSGASVANNAIAFAPSTANNEYATWNVSFAAAGNYTVTIDMTAPNGHTYGVALLSADGATEIATVAEAQAWDTGIKELGAITVPEAGNYKIKLTNATQWSEAVLNSIIVAAAPAAPEYYLAGTMNEWAAAAEGYKFAANPEAEGEYMLTITLAENAEFKVRNGDTWYPSEGGNYVVDAAHAGEKTIYFRPDGQGGEGWHYGVIYVAPNEEPIVTDGPIFEWTKGEGAKIEADNTDLNANNMGTMTVGKSVVARLLSTNPVENNAKGYKLGNNDVCVEIEGTRAFAAGDTVVITGVCGGTGARAFAVAPVTTTDAKADTVLTNTQENTSDILEYKVVLKEKQAGDKIRIFRLAGKTMYLYSIKVLPGEEPIVEPRLADGFYLNGSHVADWAVENLTAELKFEPTEENPAEYKLTTTLTEGQEIKVVKVEADAIVAWYPAEGGNYVVDAAHAGENKDIYFQETYKEDWAAFGGHIWTGANEEPQPTKYCEFATGHLKDAEFGDVNGRILLTIQKIADSNNIRVAIKNNTAAGNTKAGLNYLWVNATGAKNNNATYGSHEAEDVEEVSVIVEFDEAQESYVFNNIHWAYAGWGGEWAIDGLTVSAAELCEASTPIVEVTYYMKNNWDAGADWTWKAMTKDGENYKLEKVVFGGTGVNYNTAESDEGSSWVPVANIAGDAIAAKDTVTLVLDPAAATVTATLIGKYNDPNPGEHTYTVAGNLTAAFGTSWNAADAHNDMVLNGVGIYLWEKTELTLPAGTIEFKVCEDHAWTVAYPAENYQLAIAEAGVYTIYISFNPDTKEVTANATKTGDATVTVDYYLVGSVKGWEAKAENIFTLNAEAGEGIEEYVIETTLEVGEGLKVLSSTGAWYPDGTGNEYVVDQDHAGATTIYFRPAGNAEWAAFGGYMYVVPTGGAGIDAVDANAPAVKVLRNGQILIKKGDKTYNIMGAIVR